MELLLDGRTYTFSDEELLKFTGLFQEKILHEYAELALHHRLLAKQAARGGLAFIETKVREHQGEEAARLARPAKNSDPVPHLLGLGEKLLLEMLRHVTIKCISEQGTITDCNVSLEYEN